MNYICPIHGRQWCSCPMPVEEKVRKLIEAHVRGREMNEQRDREKDEHYQLRLVARIQELEKQLEKAEARADKFQSAYAKEFDIRNGTPCEQIRWQQTLDDTRENLANVQIERDDWIANAHRLALELNCILLSTDLPAATKWWDSAHEALEQHQTMIKLSYVEKLK